MHLRLACASAAASAAALAVAWLVVSPAGATAGYTYAGLVGSKGPLGITATLTALEAPLVEQGHVAAWVGVGGANEGPDGTAEWLQVGLNSGTGTGNRLYYEYARPGRDVTYVQLAARVPIGRPVRVAVLHCAAGRDLWRVWLDGRPVSEAISLPGSAGRLTPVATAENYDGETAGTVNTFSYSLTGIKVATAAGGPWRPFTAARLLQNGGVRTIRSTLGSFAATSVPAAEPSV
jgi:hypothetical protein